jgi:hypothetical protein
MKSKAVQIKQSNEENLFRFEFGSRMRMLLAIGEVEVRIR